MRENFTGALRDPRGDGLDEGYETAAFGLHAAYALTPEFWNAMDMLGGKASYEMGGAFNDGKGQPSQSNAVSHGCVPTRHRQINVINTGRQA